MQTPQLNKATVRRLLDDAGLTLKAFPGGAILCVRGYYRDTKGKEGVQDVGIYDDAFMFQWKDGQASVNANTDPSRVGWNPAIGKPYAMLCTGVHYFRRGAHKGRTPALRQFDDASQARDFNCPNDGKFEVFRGMTLHSIEDGSAKRERGYFAINIHQGGENGTSSWGCLTAPPEVFDNWMNIVWRETRKGEQSVVPVLLIDGPVANDPAPVETKPVSPVK